MRGARRTREHRRAQKCVERAGSSVTKQMGLVPQPVKSILAGIRYNDAFIFQVPSLVGLAFSFRMPMHAAVVRVLVFALASFLLMVHVFCFNDWSDSPSNPYHLSKRNRPVPGSKSIVRQRELAPAILPAIVSLVILAALSNTLVIIALFIVSLGIFYSFPVQRFKAKSIPVLSSVLHVAGSILSFLLGYALFSLIDLRAVVIGGYFGVVITAGHLVQEVQDYAVDRAAQISTNAVRFGKEVVFILSFGLFTFSFAYLYGLASAGWIAPELKYLMVFYPVYAFLALKTFRAGLSAENVRRFRARYRIVFGSAVSIMGLWTIVH